MHTSAYGILYISIVYVTTIVTIVAYTDLVSFDFNYMKRIRRSKKVYF